MAEEEGHGKCVDAIIRSKYTYAENEEDVRREIAGRTTTKK